MEKYYQQLRIDSRKHQVSLPKYRKMLEYMYDEFWKLSSKEKAEYKKELLQHISMKGVSLKPKFKVLRNPAKDAKSLPQYYLQLFKFLTSIGIGEKRTADALSRYLRHHNIQHDVLHTNNYARATLNANGIKFYFTS